MRKNIEISDEKINEFLEQFYSYFESGYAFEEFLKVYLEKIGLDEVVVTQRSSDGGIDLEAVRYGVGGFAGADAVDYFVQAKRNKPGTTIPIEKVRALRGVMPSGSKGIFITTASYSKKIAKNRGYLAGVTDLYKESGLIAEDGSYNPCKAIWKFSEDKIDIIIKEH